MGLQRSDDLQYDFTLECVLSMRRATIAVYPPAMCKPPVAASAFALALFTTFMGQRVAISCFTGQTRRVLRCDSMNVFRVARRLLRHGAGPGGALAHTFLFGLQQGLNVRYGLCWADVLDRRINGSTFAHGGLFVDRLG